MSLNTSVILLYVLYVFTGSFYNVYRDQAYSCNEEKEF